MFEKAAMFTPDQVKTVGDVVVLLVLMNAGSILTNTLSFMVKNYKMRKDLNEAFRRIKKLEENNKKELENEIKSSPLHE